MGVYNHHRSSRCECKTGSINAFYFTFTIYCEKLIPLRYSLNRKLFTKANTNIRLHSQGEYK